MTDKPKSPTPAPKPEKTQHYVVLTDGPAGRKGRIVKLTSTAAAAFDANHLRLASRRDIALSGGR